MYLSVLYLHSVHMSKHAPVPHCSAQRSKRHQRKIWIVENQTLLVVLRSLVWYIFIV